MIVVVGVPAWRAAEPAAPAGRACQIAVEAARLGARVELVGRTGDDAAGDALLIALSGAGIGHVAMLRDPARATPILEPEPEPDTEDALHGDDALHAGGREPGPAPAAGAAPDRSPRLEPADVSLGLEYLTDFGVLVIVDGLPDSVVPVAVDAAAFAGAHLVLLLPPGAEAPESLPANATALAAPGEADDGAFAALIGAYAAALDAGVAPVEAFAAATGDTGWEALRAG